MKIAFDLRRINNPGIGRYMKCLVEAVFAQGPEHEYLLILPAKGASPKGADSLRVERIVSDLPYYSIREQIELPRILRQHKVDLLHSPHFNLPLRRVCPTVVTIHDVIYLACPGELPSLLGRLYYRAMMLSAVRLADRVLTVSEFSRQDIIHYLHCDPGRIETIYSAVSPDFNQALEPAEIEAVLARLRIDEEFILYTGIYKPRKNHAALLQAFRLFVQNGARARLVIAGPLGEGEEVLRNLAERLGIAGHVRLAGFISDRELRALYTAARVYACPSLYEGFGFTVLEAMTCGLPVVCSSQTSLPEVAGSAALFADPRHPAAFAAALQDAFSNSELRRGLIERGLANVRRFSWAATASRTLAAYERAAGRPLEQQETAVCA